MLSSAIQIVASNGRIEMSDVFPLAMGSYRFLLVEVEFQVQVLRTNQISLHLDGLSNGLYVVEILSRYARFVSKIWKE